MYTWCTQQTNNGPQTLDKDLKDDIDNDKKKC